jgi:hypothetical protein
MTGNDYSRRKFLKQAVLAVFACIALIMLIRCTNAAPPTPVAEKEKIPVADSTRWLALQLLYNKLDKHTRVTIVQDEIRMGDSTIRISMKEEFDGQKDGKWIYAAGITCFWNTSVQQQVTVGSIGIGADKKEAISICLQEWWAVFGKPFTDMLNQDTGMVLAGLKIFPGRMGVRGLQPPGSWLNGSAAMHKKIIEGIKTLLPAGHLHKIIPVDIKLLINKDGVVDGECRIDNQISFELLKLLKVMNWPKAADRFIFTQFYLVEAPAR